jgi:tetratricopeptide (TPR) repeat protein
MLGYVLMQMPARRFRELPYSRLAPEELSHVALEWMEEGRAKEAALLLEPLFKDVEKLDARHEHAFDVLVDCYNNLGHPRKKQGLIEALMQSKDRSLRSAAMHRLCCMHSDAGEHNRAWEIFREAQRYMPDNPALSHLEVLLLLSQGRRAEAIERGKFWIARLSRDGNHDHDDLIEALKSLTQDPEEMLLGMMGRGVPGLAELAEALKALPPPACHYALHPQGESAGPLEPSKPLRELERKWRAMVDGSKPDLVALSGPSLRFPRIFIEGSMRGQPVRSVVEWRTTESGRAARRRASEAGAAPA